MVIFSDLVTSYILVIKNFINFMYFILWPTQYIWDPHSEENYSPLNQPIWIYYKFIHPLCNILVKCVIEGGSIKAEVPNGLVHLKFTPTPPAQAFSLIFHRGCTDFKWSCSFVNYLPTAVLWLLSWKPFSLDVLGFPSNNGLVLAGSNTVAPWLLLWLTFCGESEEQGKWLSICLSKYQFRFIHLGTSQELDNLDLIRDNLLNTAKLGKMIWKSIIFDITINGDIIHLVQV